MIFPIQGKYYDQSPYNQSPYNQSAQNDAQTGVFRVYVKSLHDKAVYRSEESFTLKRILPKALESQYKIPIQISWEEVR